LIFNPYYHEGISKIEIWFEVKELLKRTAEYPPAMQVLGRAIICGIDKHLGSYLKSDQRPCGQVE
jgi:hypothetical protein